MLCGKGLLLTLVERHAIVSEVAIGLLTSSFFLLLVENYNLLLY